MRLAPRYGITSSKHSSGRNWCSFSGKVKIKDGSQILQKNTKFTWRGLDLPQDDIGVFQYSPEPLDSKVIEYVPEQSRGCAQSVPSEMKRLRFKGCSTFLATKADLCDAWLLDRRAILNFAQISSFSHRYFIASAAYEPS
jgi:hypothetical protein